VQIRTRSVATVDDVVAVERVDGDEDEEMGERVSEVEEEDDGEKETRESRVRRLSCLEVTIRMKAV
jgi:uncharacterized ferredoxin-like protein